MTGRRPAPGPVPPDPPDQRGKAAPSPTATDQSDIVQPFLVGGGFRRFFAPSTGGDYIGRTDGIQLVAAVYVPDGKIGFLKQLRCAPLAPAVFVDPWNTVGVPRECAPGEVSPGCEPRATWRTSKFDGVFSNVGDTLYPDVWRSPFAWEGYCTPGQDENRFPATWTWQISLVQGTIEQIRQSRNLPAFDPDLPESYYLVPNYPADFALAYGGAIPGGQVGIIYGPQRYQVIQSDELDLHIPIPPNSTLCLFTRWTQLEAVSLSYAATDGAGGSYPYKLGTEDGSVEFPLGPSVGQMSGYMQPVRSKGSVQNAVYGWGG